MEGTGISAERMRLVTVYVKQARYSLEPRPEARAVTLLLSDGVELRPPAGKAGLHLHHRVYSRSATVREALRVGWCQVLY